MTQENKEKLLDRMSEVVNEHMTGYKSDFEKYDRQSIMMADDDAFPIIWVVSESLTILMSAGKPYRDAFFNQESERYVRFQIMKNKDCDLMCYTREGDRVFMITEDGSLQETTAERVREFLKQEQLKIMDDWIGQGGCVPDDKEFKMRVRLHNITFSRLKELIRDCEAHGDNSLLMILRRFHRSIKLGHDHYYDIYWREEEDEFGYYERRNGETRLEGGIVFHGWPETGYKENGSVQMSPRYGWGSHS